MTQHFSGPVRSFQGFQVQDPSGRWRDGSVHIDPATNQPYVLNAAGQAVALGGAVEQPASVFPDWVLISSTGAVCGSPCVIHRIRCVSGTSVVLTVYDNAAASAGTVLYTGTLSAGQEAAIFAPVRAINGVRAVFASGSFEFYVSQES